MQDHEHGAMIYVFLGPCSLVSEHLCRLCHGMAPIHNWEGQKHRLFLVYSRPLSSDATNDFSAIHVDFVTQSSVILLLLFAYRLYIIGGDSLTPRFPLSPLQISGACLFFSVPMAFHTVSCVLLLLLFCFFCIWLLLMSVQAAYYLHQGTAPLAVLQQLQLDGYTASSEAQGRSFCNGSFRFRSVQRHGHFSERFNRHSLASCDDCHFLRKTATRSKNSTVGTFLSYQILIMRHKRMFSIKTYVLQKSIEKHRHALIARVLHYLFVTFSLLENVYLGAHLSNAAAMRLCDCLVDLAVRCRTDLEHRIRGANYDDCNQKTYSGSIFLINILRHAARYRSLHRSSISRYFLRSELSYRASEQRKSPMPFPRSRRPLSEVWATCDFL